MQYRSTNLLSLPVAAAVVVFVVVGLFIYVWLSSRHEYVLYIIIGSRFFGQKVVLWLWRKLDSLFYHSSLELDMGGRCMENGRMPGVAYIVVEIDRVWEKSRKGTRE